MFDKSKGQSPPLEAVLEPELIESITKLLDDRNPQVKVAAGITLYSLNKPSDKVNIIYTQTSNHSWLYNIFTYCSSQYRQTVMAT